MSHTFKYIQIQLIERCNLKCPFCPNSYIEQTGNLMSEEVYKKLIQDLVDIEYKGSLAFHLMNEPTLDKRLFKFIEKAKKHFPTSRMYLSTNGTLVDKEYIDNLFKAGITILSISCYKNNIFDKYKHLQSANINVHNLTNENDNLFYNRGGNVKYGNKIIGGNCIKPFEIMNVKWDGKAVLCCSDYKNEAVMGDINKNSLIEIFNNDIYKKYREHLSQGLRDLPLCNKCNF